MKLLGVDCESTYGKKEFVYPWMDGFYLSCVGLVTEHTEEVLWFDHAEKMPTTRVKQKLQDVVDRAGIITGHNLKWDLNILRHYCGIDFRNKQLFCTMIGDYLLSGQNTRKYSFSLNDVCARYGMTKKLDKVAEYWKTGVDTYDIPAQILEEYVLDDTRKAYNLCKLEQNKIDALKINKIVMLQNEFIYSLSDMEMNGFKWDTEKSDSIIKETKDELSAIEEELFTIIDIPHVNLASPSQLSTVLYGGLLKTQHFEWTKKTFKNGKVKEWNKEIPEETQIDGLGFTPLKNTETKREGIYKTDTKTLKRLVCRTPIQRNMKKLLFRLSSAQKVLSTMVGKTGGLSKKVQADGNIHSSFNQTVAVTGRLSSSNPNGQNIPRSGTSPIKQCIIPTLDGILNFDLSQIEWRVAAQLSQDTTMIAEINNNVDQHSAACVDLMELELTKENRFFAKIFNFRMIYGGAAYGFYMDDAMPAFSHKKWKGIVEGFYDKYAGLQLWQDKNIQYVYKNGYLQAPTGRVFIFNKDTDTGNFGVYNEKKIKNYPVQGVAGGDILPLLTILLRRGMQKYDLKSKMILTVHDSVVFDYHNDELGKLVKLCNAAVEGLTKNIKSYFGIPWNVNLAGDVEIGDNYGSLKAV